MPKDGCAQPIKTAYGTGAPFPPFVLKGNGCFNILCCRKSQYWHHPHNWCHAQQRFWAAQQHCLSVCTSQRFMPPTARSQDLASEGYSSPLRSPDLSLLTGFAVTLLCCAGETGAKGPGGAVPCADRSPTSSHGWPPAHPRPPR